MNRQFFKLAFRHFSKNRSFIIFNMAGLTSAIGAFILISLYVQYEMSWDQFNEKHKQIYRIEPELHLANKSKIQRLPQAPWPTGVELKEQYSEITDYAALADTWGQYMSVSKEKEPVYEEQGYYANNKIFDLFTLRFLRGSPDNALSEPHTMVLTQKLAEKYFPKKNPIGKTILIDNKHTYRVTGVIETPPSNFHLEPSYFLSVASFHPNNGWDIQSNWDNYSARVYVLLHQHVDPNAFEEKIRNFLYKKATDTESVLHLKNLADIHLQPSNGGSLLGVIYIFAFAGFSILLLGGINFTNLTMAYMTTRHKEVGIKKVMGGSRRRIIQSILGESLMITVISLILAFTIVELVLPLFNQVVSRELKIQYIDNWPMIVFLCGVSVSLGILAALHPALKFSRFSPVEAIKGQKQSNKKPNKLRITKTLTVFQLFISILFVLSALDTYHLVSHFTEMDMGFQEENLVVCKIDEEGEAHDWNAIQGEILSQNNIISASISRSAPFQGSNASMMSWEGSMADEKLLFSTNEVGKDFLDTYKIKLIAGRGFTGHSADSGTQECIINEMVMNKTGWDDPIGKTIDNGKYRIVGVINDYHRMSPVVEIMPMILLPHDGMLKGNNMISMRIRPGYMKKAHEDIRKTLTSLFPNAIVDPQTMEDTIQNEKTNNIYKSIADSFVFFAIVSIAIAVVGLFSMVSFTAKSRVKEIGIRKVLGASSRKIYSSMLRTYLTFYLIAGTLASLINYLTADMDPAVYRPEPDPWIYVFTLSGALMVILLTINFQILKTARTNPVESLRDE